MGPPPERMMPGWALAGTAAASQAPSASRLQPAYRFHAFRCRFAIAVPQLGQLARLHGIDELLPRCGSYGLYRRFGHLGLMTHRKALNFEAKSRLAPVAELRGA